MHNAANWESYLDRVDANVADLAMRRQLRKAVLTMRRHLGEDWPSRSNGDRNILRFFLGNVSGAVSDYLLVIWGDAISAVESVSGFDGMLAKLRGCGVLESTLVELEVAGRLAGRGARVELEPEAGRKRPDLLCQYGGSEFFLEVKTLFTACKTRQAMETFMRITAACQPVQSVGRIFKILSGQDLEKAACILRKAAGMSIDHNVPIEVDMSKVLRVYLAPDRLAGRAERIEEWFGEQERMGVMQRTAGWMAGPPHHMTQERRARDRINKVARESQIPPDRTGVVVVRGPFLFADAGGAERSVTYITNGLARLRNVPAVVLVSDKTFGGSEESAVSEMPGFTFMRSRLHDMVYEDTVIIRNPFCKIGFDHESLKSVLAPDGAPAA